ncbi:MAG TPA: hypothetical protein VJ741_17100 [Solirubrobacteraceae bacterium]|nr:hypothetical protein [Solirubrobacteraceae bacterium]
MVTRPHPRAAWPSGDDNAGFNLLVILVGVGVGSYLLWSTCHGQISAAVLALRHHEIALLHRITDRFDLADRQMMAADPNGVTPRDLYGISRAIGAYWRIPGAIFIIALALACKVRNAPSRFRRRFDLGGLVREQARFFPTSAAFVDRHLRLVPPADAAPRPADYALTPGEWIARFARTAEDAFDEAAARRALASQLGPRWTGPRQASPAVRCLMAVFALHLGGRRDEALHLLGACSTGLADTAKERPEGPKISLALSSEALAVADAVLADVEGVARQALAIAGRHAYATPALMSVLNAARREAGVLAPAQFAWLKLVDRPLWYALHALGYETEGTGRYLHPNPRVEAAGARDHWAAERAVGHPIPEPGVDRAIEALWRAAGPHRPTAIGDRTATTQHAG